FHFQHHDRDDDRDHAVAESLQSSRPHLPPFGEDGLRVARHPFASNKLTRAAYEGCLRCGMRFVRNGDDSPDATGWAAPGRAQRAGTGGGGALTGDAFDPGRACAYISHAMALYRPERSSPTV